MTTSVRPPRLLKTLGSLALALGLTAALAACGPASGTTAEAPAASSSTDSGVWPRTITHELGDTTIPVQPKKVVSTSLTLTGTLLAIDAPVFATAAGTPGNGLDKSGFFDQWGPVADKRGVEVLYPNLELDLEAVTAAKPDLIVISVTGADSTKDAYDALSKIAPTIALNYSTQSWEDIATKLGPALGLEKNVESTISDFSAKIAEAKAKIVKPAGDVQAIVFNGAQEDAAFALPSGPHNALLTELGLPLTNPEFPGDKPDASARKDFQFVSAENSVISLVAPTVLLVSADDATKEKLIAAAPFANIPALNGGTVIPLGLNSFRIDYYSALEVANTLVNALRA
ncbi:Fe2+-enterobactin ABC transporter substrate-binding protein [Mycetocola tolaasinivorans]|uniref:Fe2+-enterobactin ABC transporter substrate-binding protein n=1 Tax=Mycetocola tolaasinivorans TaxID=76635 RepID=A0A3L7A2H6_9MICO|nr:Fe2+-enterobactin ABC transporter substrate-binding protein [Mycetocola tolaasinivorans]RLP74513.1 Fe2+-enterobactin ABC transporter substrate-binding protein [Mycetocola tolaasinivorans]